MEAILYKSSWGISCYRVCRECGSKNMKHEPSSINNNYYLCMHCGSVEQNPELELAAGCYKQSVVLDPNDRTLWVSHKDLASIIRVEIKQLN